MKQFNTNLRTVPKQQIRLAIVTLSLASIGTLLLVNSYASTPLASIEPEDGTLATAASKVVDPTASNGSAVKFKAATSGSCPSGQIGTSPACYPAPPAPLQSGKQWKMLFNDEFDGNSLNTSNFSPCFDWNYGDCNNSFNNGKEHYDPAQVQVGQGTAKLVAEPQSPALTGSAGGGCYQSKCTYKSGMISTSRPQANNGSAYLHPFTYGYVEANMKYPAVSGFFSAFWMLPTDPSFSYRSEIDIVEILGGEPTTIFMTYHYNDRSQSYGVNDGGGDNGACQAKNYSTDFVRFGMDWEPTYIAWYINGVKCGQFNGNTSTIESGPMQIILDLMVDNDWERDSNLTLANQTLKNQIELDYLRVYQQK